MDSAINQLTLGSVLTITSSFERHLAAARLNDHILSRRQVSRKIVDYIKTIEPHIIVMEESSAHN